MRHFTAFPLEEPVLPEVLIELPEYAVVEVSLLGSSFTQVSSDFPSEGVSSSGSTFIAVTTVSPIPLRLLSKFSSNRCMYEAF